MLELAYIVYPGRDPIGIMVDLLVLVVLAALVVYVVRALIGR